jgi:hypothetical protein
VLGCARFYDVRSGIFGDNETTAAHLASSRRILVKIGLGAKWCWLFISGTEMKSKHQRICNVSIFAKLYNG